MNLLEHYIKEIHSIQDVTNRFMENVGHMPHEPLYKIDLTYNCYGKIERDVKHFFKTEWEDVREKGYFMA